jgi:hypothetical protein
MSVLQANEGLNMLKAAAMQKSMRLRLQSQSQDFAARG